MVRRNPLKSLFTLMAATAVLSGATVGLEAAAPGGAVSNIVEAAKGRPLVESTRHATLIYDESLTGDEVLQRAAADTEKLGFKMVKTLASAKAVVVAATPKQAQARLASAEGIPIRTVAPTYLGDGDPHPLSMMAFTGRVQVTFAKSAREADKQRFYAENGLKLVYESSNGSALLETGRHPDAAMISFSDTLATNPAVEHSVAEIAFTGEPTAAAQSFTISDPYFGLQWPLFSDGQNTNYGYGKSDADMDVPRAWMHNKTLGNSTYGNAAVSVAVFDSGTERTHPDLATSLDPLIGRDAVDGGLPDPVRNTLGAHGTAMASIVAGAANSQGMIGVAPGVKIYTSRIFASDYSTTNARISSSLTDTVSAGIDVNLHPYVIPVACSSELIVPEVEAAFRQTFRSGRDGVGLVNVAAAGNFFSQTEYPASSAYTVAVGGHSAEDNRLTESNWGGQGVDIVMPSYRINANSSGDETYGTGIIAADLRGPEGYGGSVPSVTGNTNSEWGSLGNILTFARTTASVADSYLGTSVSAAYAAGAAALILSDERYTCMAPLIDYGAVNSRQDRRDRRDPGASNKTALPKTVENPGLCPPREDGGDTILQVMTSFNDLPSPTRTSQPDTDYTVGCGFDIPDPALDTRGKFEYINSYNEIMGFGRFNPARALATNPEPTGDTFNTLMMDTTSTSPTLVNYTFGAAGTPTRTDDEGNELPFDPFTVEDRATIAFGWRATGEDSNFIDGLQTIIEDENGNEDVKEPFGQWILAGRGGIITSPYLEPVDSILFEDGSQKPEPGDPGPIYVWTDSIPTNAGVDLQDDPNLIYNPRGAYQRNTTIELAGPKEKINTAFAGSETPALVTIEIGFELGVQIASSTTAAQVREQIDTLALDVSYFIETDTGSSEVRKTIHSFTGDTFGTSKKRLCAPDELRDVTTGSTTVTYPIWYGEYDVTARTSEMPIRKFQFMMPPIPEGTTEVQFKLRLSPGSSYLPTYEYDQNGVPVQMLNVFRDHGGFVFYSLNATMMSKAQADYLASVDRDIPLASQQVVLTNGGNEVLYANSVGEFSIGAVNARGERLADGTDELDDRVNYQGSVFMGLNSRITGMKANPVKEQIAITTADGNIYTATTDGINQRLLINDPGARDPAWNSTGTAILYATPNAIKALNFQTDGTVISETILSDTSAVLTDFRTPVFNEDSGVVYFTAVHKTESPAIRRIHIATRTGRIINLSGEDSLAALAGWSNVDCFDLDISQSGRRLVFVAYTREAPELDPDNGEVLAPAFRSGTEAPVFSIENINWVSAYRNIPIYRKVYQERTAGGASTLFARYPRLSVNDKSSRPRLAFTMLTTRPVIASTAEVGTRVAIRQLSVEDAECAKAPPAPTPAPTTTPVTTVTPPPLDIAQIVQMSEITFESSREGWNFGSAAPTYLAPASGSVLGNRTVSPAVDGSLTLTTAGNNYTFGFWTSPVPAFSIVSDSLYLVRSRVRATSGVPDSQVPGMRMRANSGTNENAVLITTNSRGDNSLTPVSTESRYQDLIIAPPAGQLLATNEFKSYSVSFDLANFASDDSSTAGLKLEQVEIYRLDNAAKHIGLWCFEVPASGADVSFTVTGSSQIESGLYLDLRSCCGDAASTIKCAAGTSGSGVTLTQGALAPGQYSLVASSSLGEDLTLTYTASVDLLANCAPCITTKEGQFDSILTACQTSVAISGASGTSSRPTFYDGTGIFPLPVCDPVDTNTVVKATELLYSNTLDSDAERSQWGTGGATGYTLPDFTSTSTGLGIQFANRSNLGFGFWVLDGDDIPLPDVAAGDEGPWIYRATAVLSSEVPAANALNVPVVRLRLATGDFQRIAEAVIEPGNNQNIVPVAGRPVKVELYLPLNVRPADVSTLVFAYDLIDAFPTRPAVTVPVVLEDLRIERVSIPSYPAEQ
ncbi:S8 family serine peptidase [bacterium]|nr:S8 family serine peptidase [bacterium]